MSYMRIVSGATYDLSNVPDYLREEVEKYVKEYTEENKEEA